MSHGAGSRCSPVGLGSLWIESGILGNAMADDETVKGTLPQKGAAEWLRTNWFGIAYATFAVVVSVGVAYLMNQHFFGCWPFYRPDGVPQDCINSWRDVF